MECQVREEPGCLAVSGEMSIYTAAELKRTLFDRCNSAAGDCLIDLANVTTLDTAGLQILLLTNRMARAGGRAFAVINPSDPARETLQLAGLTDFIVAVPRREVRAKSKARKRTRTAT